MRWDDDALDAAARWLKAFPPSLAPRSKIFDIFQNILKGEWRMKGEGQLTVYLRIFDYFHWRCAVAVGAGDSWEQWRSFTLRSITTPFHWPRLSSKDCRSIFWQWHSILRAISCFFLLIFPTILSFWTSGMLWFIRWKMSPHVFPVIGE